MKRIFATALLLSYVFITSCADRGESTTTSTNTTTAEDKTSNDVTMDTSNNMNGTNTAGDAHDDKDDDTKFALKAASGGMMEVELGRLALRNATSAEVKKFAQMMVDDHSKANKELMDVAKAKGITIPTAMEEDHQKHVTELSEKKGLDFDKSYMDLMVEDHEDDVEDFKKAAEKCKDAELKAWAAGKVSKLQHHLDMAKTTKQKVDDKK